jgi:transposase-like protein
MSTPQTIIRPEVRQQIIERVKQGDKPIPDIAAEHGISPNVIYGWLSREAAAPPSILELTKLKRENQALLELIGKITLELSTVKKKSNG